jgi:hypothetical protein
LSRRRRDRSAVDREEPVCLSVCTAHPLGLTAFSCRFAGVDPARRAARSTPQPSR